MSGATDAASLTGNRGKVLVCFAVREEAACFQREHPPSHHANVHVIITGMGKWNAERTIRQALASDPSTVSSESSRNPVPELVLSCGFAGGLDPALTSGTVVYDAPQGTELRDLLGRAGARAVRFHCADRVAVTAVEKSELRRTTGADAVEMESAVIGAVCVQQNVPFATVRVILDEAEEDLPLDFNRLMTSDMRMSYVRLAFAIARAPQTIGALRRLQRQSNAAAGSLATFLYRVLAAESSH